MTDADIRMISVEEVHRLVEKSSGPDDRTVLLIDARPASQFVQGHLPRAANIPLQRIDPERDKDPRISRYENLVVYGEDPASATARAMTKRLMAVGYEGVRMFAGGMAEWRARGFPVENPPVENPPVESPSSGMPPGGKL